MEFKDYDEQTKQSSVYPGQGTVFGLAYVALGVAGEAGEMADKVKKVLRDQIRDPNIPTAMLSLERREALLSELGDVIWYCSATARELGSSLEDVAESNIEKITRRKSNGTLHGSGDDR